MIFCGDIFAVYAEIYFVEIDARNSITYLKFVIFFGICQQRGWAQLNISV